MTPPHSSLFPHQSNLSIAIVLAVIFLAFFFIGIFSIYFCRCLMDSLTNRYSRRNPSSNTIDDSSADPGLDPSLILLFPSFNYSSVNNLKWVKNFGTECSICLAEFEDDDSLRLLTICLHVFHQECIDLWLRSNITCPVCRSDLDLPKETLEKARNSLNLPGETLEKSQLLVNEDTSCEKKESVLEHAIWIDVREEEKSRGRNSERIITQNIQKNVGKIERFSRSHSTGHSIAVRREEEDTYSLRLLEHVNIKLKTQHNATESCIPFKEFSSFRYGADLEYM